MANYRYAKSNGEFLKSKFVQNVESGNTNDFTQSEAYDLKKNIAYGTDPNQNSFTTTLGSKNYYDAGSSLVAWWRLNKDVSSAGSGIDSSGNNHKLSPPTDADRPSFDNGDTPTTFIQESSCLFDGTNVLEATDSNSFSFGDSVKDQPFSISCWVKTSDLTKTNIIVSKSEGVAGEWYLGLTPTGAIQIGLIDATMASKYAFANAPASTILINTWTHIVATYNGKAKEASTTTSDNGLKIYVNGVNKALTFLKTPNYVAMENTSYNVAIGNYDTESSASALHGNLADVAIWSGELSQTDITTLYNIKIAGAYRLVRDFNQLSPENDTRLFGVKTSGRGVDLSGLPSDILEQFRQGINVNTHKQLGSYTSFKIRSSNSNITTLNGVDISTKTFDETIATTTYSSGSKAVARVSFGGTGRLSSRISHQRELRDLGQSEVYFDHDKYEIYEDTLDLNPAGIVSTNPDKLVLPRQLVVQTSNELNDGAIEPLIIRKKIDHTSIEAPYFAHDIRASLGGLEGPFRRSMILVYGKDLDEPKEGCAPFLDATETFGNIDMPGAFSIDAGKIEPYVDYLNGRDKEYTTNGITSTIATVMILSASFETANIRTHDKMAASGFVFDNDNIGLDSIAYGGLKK